MLRLSRPSLTEVSVTPSTLFAHLFTSLSRNFDGPVPLAALGPECKQSVEGRREHPPGPGEYWQGNTPCFLCLPSSSHPPQSYLYLANQDSSALTWELDCKFFVEASKTECLMLTRLLCSASCARKVVNERLANNVGDHGSVGVLEFIRCNSIVFPCRTMQAMSSVFCECNARIVNMRERYGLCLALLGAPDCIK